MFQDRISIKYGRYFLDDAHTMCFRRGGMLFHEGVNYSERSVQRFLGQKIPAIFLEILGFFPQFKGFWDFFATYIIRQIIFKMK